MTLESLGERVARLEGSLENTDLAALTNEISKMGETVRITHHDHERRLTKLEAQSIKLLVAVTALSALGAGTGSVIVGLFGG